jgi:hypothetical protein
MLNVETAGKKDAQGHIQEGGKYKFHKVDGEIYTQIFVFYHNRNRCNYHCLYINHENRKGMKQICCSNSGDDTYSTDSEVR